MLTKIYLDEKLLEKDKPEQDSSCSMVVAMLQAPTKLHQSCRHLISRLKAHLEELQVPSIQAVQSIFTNYYEGVLRFAEQTQTNLCTTSLFQDDLQFQLRT